MLSLHAVSRRAASGRFWFAAFLYACIFLWGTFDALGAEPFKIYEGFRHKTGKSAGPSYFYLKEPGPEHPKAVQLIEIQSFDRDGDKTIHEESYYNAEGRLIEYSRVELSAGRSSWLKVEDGKIKVKLTEEGSKDFEGTFDAKPNQLMFPELESYMAQKAKSGAPGEFKFEVFFPASARYGGMLSSFQIKAQTTEEDGLTKFRLTPASYFVRTLLPEEKEVIVMHYDHARQDFVFVSFDGVDYTNVK